MADQTELNVTLTYGGIDLPGGVVQLGDFQPADITGNGYGGESQQNNQNRCCHQSLHQSEAAANAC